MEIDASNKSDSSANGGLSPACITYFPIQTQDLTVEISSIRLLSVKLLKKFQSYDKI